MSNHYADNNENDSPQNPIPPVGLGDKQGNKGIKPPHDRENPTDHTKPKPKVFKRIITLISNDKNQPLITNIIYVVMLVVSAILALYTYRVFNQTIEQTKQATIAADAAKRSSDLQKQSYIMDTISRRKSDASDAIKEQRANKLFEIQDSSLKAQIASLKETQKEFEVSHSPYITVANFRITANDSLEIDIQNQGTQIAIVLATQIAIKADRATRVNNGLKSPDDVNGWLPVKNTPISSYFLIAPGNDIRFHQFIADTDRRDIGIHKKILYVRVLIYYFNTTTSKYMTFQSISKWNPNSGGIGTLYFGYKILKKFP